MSKMMALTDSGGMAFEPWRIEQATRMVATLENTCRLNGYLLAMYGSVARGELGKDLDLLLVPWRYGVTSSPEMIELISKLVQAKIIAPLQSGIMAESAVLELESGHKLDIQIRAGRG